MQAASLFLFASRQGFQVGLVAQVSNAVNHDNGSIELGTGVRPNSGSDVQGRKTDPSRRNLWTQRISHDVNEWRGASVLVERGSQIMPKPLKVRESGMPEEAAWESFFNASAAIEKLLGAECVAGDVVEFGCGYGTFTIPAALRLRGIVTALDIEPVMVDRTQQRARNQALSNICAEVRDFVAQGTGLRDDSQAHAMIFNLLHLLQPVTLLKEAYRVLHDGGRLSVIHWRSDIPTPRGPSLSIRPTPDQCRTWIAEAGFRGIQTVDLESCCPYHFGLIARRATT